MLYNAFLSKNVNNGRRTRTDRDMFKIPSWTHGFLLIDKSTFHSYIGRFRSSFVADIRIQCDVTVSMVMYFAVNNFFYEYNIKFVWFFFIFISLFGFQLIMEKLNTHQICLFQFSTLLWYSAILYVCATNDSDGDYMVKKNVSLCKFGIIRKINHSSFQRCKNFKITRTNNQKNPQKTNERWCTFCVDVDMFYKSAHNFM